MTDFTSANSDGLTHVAQSTPHGFLGIVAGDGADQGFVPPPPQFRGGLPPRMLRRVLEHIEAHLESNISLQDLATTAGLSSSHFARAFKQSQGMTPHRYLMSCRLRQALQLLTGTDLPLSEIAVATGFADQSHFSRQFRKNVGTTPSGYRWSTR
jgi:transcriptional regulator GlxA family with amidase domain